MVFVKVIKDKAYHKRYQTKFRRRREGKTDYYARKRLVAQAKNKYHSHKYRMIVRFSNKDIVCQIAYATITGDFIVAAAYSHELPRYGIALGLTNYAAAYATGLLLARRVLAKFNLGDLYIGNESPELDYTVNPVKNGPAPLTCLLDVGLARTTTGSRLFAAMKGMCDGGVRVPHSERRFVGYKNNKLDASVLRKYILGGHIAAYMKILLQKNPERFDKQFSRYKKAGIKPADIEKMYLDAHKKIRADPAYTKKPAKQYTKEQKAKYTKKRKLSLAERKGRVKCKMIQMGLVGPPQKKRVKKVAKSVDEVEEPEPVAVAATPAKDEKKGDAKKDDKKADAKGGDAKKDDKKGDAKKDDKKADAKGGDAKKGDAKKDDKAPAKKGK